MVDRQMVYTGALPQTTDILSTNKNMMLGLGYGMQMVLGTNTYVDGLACLPTSGTPDLHVNIQVGSIYSLVAVDATAYSDLSTDATFVVKQGINPSIQVLTITPPGTVGQSQVYLVQAEYSDVDGGAQVESYFNASNPLAPFSGPANAGTSNNTVRKGVCTIALKAGTAAATGSQTTPSPDAGFTGLFAVTVANGQTQITSPNIVQLTTAPIVGATNKLPAIPNSVQAGIWSYGIDTSPGGAAPVTTATTTTASAVLTFAGGVPAYVATGMKAFDITTPAAITGGQTVLSKTGTTVTLSAVVNATVGSGDSIAFSTNAMVAALSPVPGSLTTGMEIHVQAAGTNSGATTLNLNGLGAVNVKRGTGVSLGAGDITANEVLALVYDGASWQIQNFSGSGSGTVTNNTIAIPYGSDTSSSSNTITVTPSPSLPGSIAAGQALIVKLANPVTGATTIGIAGVTGTPFQVVSFTGLPLTFGSASAGEMLWMLYDGSKFQIINPPQPLQQNLTIFVNPSTGSDSFDGSQATVSGTKGPLVHIQTAINKAFNYPPSQFSITIQLADGTYNEAVQTPTIPGPALVLNGNVGSPANVLITGLSTGANTVAVFGPNTMTVQNLKFTTGTFANGPPTGLVAAYGATLNTFNTINGFCHGDAIEATFGGTTFVGNHTVAGNCGFGVYAANGTSTLTFQFNQVTTISTPMTVQAFVIAEASGCVTYPPSPFTPTFVNPGNVTGPKYLAFLNGVINTAGQGVNYLPGNSAGTITTGGQYG